MGKIEVISCGDQLCKDGKEHDMLGPTVEFTSGCSHCIGEENPNPDCKRCKGDPNWSYVSGESASCSRCGIDAMTLMLFSGE